MPKAKVGDIEVYYEIHGEGEPLVLIEGLGYYHWMWFRQVPELSKHFQVIAFDNRGVGDTDKPDVEYSIKMFADDTAGLLKELGIEKANVLGVSMGGFIAQELALSHPDLVKRLVLVCTTFGGPESVPMTMEAWQVLNSGKPGASAREVARTALSVAVSPEFMESEPDTVEFIIDKQFENLQPVYAYRRQFAAALEFWGKDNTAGRVGSLSIPTLVIHGSADRTVPVANAERLAARIPGAQLKIIEGAGHLVFIERPEEFNKAVIEFLKS